MVALGYLAFSSRGQAAVGSSHSRKKMAVSRRTKFVLLALLSVCASVYCCGAYFLMSFNAGNSNDPEGFDRIAIAWVVGAVVMLCVAVGLVVMAWRSKAST
jgi:membrane protein DedA with SNARE-associated domain